MKRMGPWERFPEVERQLQGDGVLLASVDASGRPNVMTIGWGLVGTVWRRPVFLVLVRPSRYTHGCIEKSEAFTVNVPLGTMAEVLAFCGSHSGRDMDKIVELGLELEPGRAGPVPLVGGCDIHYECRVVGHTRLLPEGLEGGIRSRYYRQGDLHTLFFGEILATWSKAPPGSF
jgi:flavin reductase (DIM6/NTAB) family NADH-FMN oxidoreductase RutF